MADDLPQDVLLREVFGSDAQVRRRLIGAAGPVCIPGHAGGRGPSGQKLRRNLPGGEFVPIHPKIHAAHRGFIDRPAQFCDQRRNFRMAIQHRLPGQNGRLVGRKETPVVFQPAQPVVLDPAIRRKSAGHVHFTQLQRIVEQSGIQLAAGQRRQVVVPPPGRIPIRPLHEFRGKAEFQLRRRPPGVEGPIRQSADHYRQQCRGHDPAATAAQAPFAQRQQPVGQQGQHRRRHRPEQNHRHVIRRETAKDEGAQTAGADQRAQRGHTDIDDRRRADARKDDRQGQGQFHLHQHLPFAHAHAPGRVDDRRRHASQPGDGVAHDRQQRVQKQRNDGRAAADPADRQQEPQQGHAGNRLHNVRQGDQWGGQAPDPRRHHAGGQSDQRCRQHRHEHQLEMLTGPLP